MKKYISILFILLYSFALGIEVYPYFTDYSKQRKFNNQKITISEQYEFLYSVAGIERSENWIYENICSEDYQKRKENKLDRINKKIERHNRKKNQHSSHKVVQKIKLLRDHSEIQLIIGGGMVVIGGLMIAAAISTMAEANDDYYGEGEVAASQRVGEDWISTGLELIGLGGIIIFLPIPIGINSERKHNPKSQFKSTKGILSIVSSKDIEKDCVEKYNRKLYKDIKRGQK